MDEEWRDILGWKGLYQVSDRGRVRSLDRIVAHSAGGERLYPGRVLRPQTNGEGYLRVHLSRGGNVVRRYIHQLVLQAFAGPAPGGHEAHHTDGDPAGNHIGNLAWVPSFQHKSRHAQGEANPRAKLTSQGVEAIRYLYAEGEHTQAQVGLMFDVSVPTVSQIVRGETWPGAGGPIAC